MGDEQDVLALAALAHLTRLTITRAECFPLLTNPLLQNGVLQLQLLELRTLIAASKLDIVLSSGCLAPTAHLVLSGLVLDGTGDEAEDVQLYSRLAASIP